MLITINRKKHRSFSILLLVALASCAANDVVEPSVIPLPQEISVAAGYFSIDPSTRISLSDKHPGLNSAAQFFVGTVKQPSGFELTIEQRSSEGSGNSIDLVLQDRGLGDEGYELAVTKDGIQITAKTSQGIFYGLQSLRQLLPSQIESSEQVDGLQASMWTENVQTKERADFMIFPRLTAFAEAAWTDASNKDYEKYRQRLKPMLERYDVLNINYFDPFTPENTPEPQR